MPETGGADPASGPFAVHLLDQGPSEYGDAILCQFGSVTVLIDGAHPGDQVSKQGHPSIPQQLAQILNQQPPHRVDLLIVSHAHQDHIGCLPFLVKNGQLEADWALVADPGLGWGHAANDSTDAFAEHPAARDPAVRQLAAALREPIRTAGTDANALWEFLVDAASLEQNYNEMLDLLADRGTHVVRYGIDDHDALVAAFENVGLRIVGPSDEQLVVCADRIAGSQQDAVSMAADLVASGRAAGRDAVADAVTQYRQLFQSMDSVDAATRLGAAVNLQSIVTRFEFRGHKLLFTGDMQLAKPGVSGVENTVEELRQAIQADGPYTFLKMGHHGSDNAFDEAFLDQLGGATFYGICAGSGSRSHPDPDTLDVLQEHAGSIRWARTDHNGRSTLIIDEAGPRFEITSGTLNDPSPPGADVQAEQPERRIATSEGGLPSVREPAPAVVTPTVTQAATRAAPSDMVEVITRVPHVNTRVTITIDVEPSASRPPPTPIQRDETPPGRDSLTIAGGRSLTDVLFVTNRTRLAANIGQTETDQLLTAIRGAGLQLADDVQGAADMAAWLRPSGQQRLPRGVVLIGGYDVLPPQRVDALDRALRDQLTASGYRGTEPDDFIVWSDDVYGDTDGDRLPEIPVSRIPDGKSPELVFTAIQAGARPVGTERLGIRNAQRPFAEAIFKALPGGGVMLVSEPTEADQQPPYDLNGARIYVMLHGSHEDGTRFWGEAASRMIEALTIGNVPRVDGSTVLSGCCWGALIVDKPAVLQTEGQPFASRTPSASIALTFLANGARAFVGCTGAHYSPVVRPFGHFGGPIHDAFWARYNAGSPPAAALFEAKVRYLAEMPHGRNDLRSQAIEKKILRQFTCLGLGW